MSKEIAKTAKALPAAVEPSPEIKERMLEVRDNMESIENFRLPRAKMTAEGFELIEGEKPVTELEGVVIHTKKTNVFYAKPFNPNEVAGPDCYSLDGERPATEIKKPQHVTCKGCPKAEFGTNTMGSGKACRNLKPLYMLLSDSAIMPRQVTVTPASLRAANQYLMDLTERGFNYRKVRTKVVAYKKNPRDTYLTLKFQMGKKLDDQEAKNVEFLKNQWLPVMNNQAVDHADMDRADAAQPMVDTNGQF